MRGRKPLSPEFVRSKDIHFRVTEAQKLVWSEGLEKFGLAETINICLTALVEALRSLSDNSR